MVSDIFMYLRFELQSSLHGYYFLLNLLFKNIFFYTSVETLDSECNSIRLAFIQTQPD